MILSFIKSLSLILIPAVMQVGFVTSASVEPEEAVAAMMDAIKAQDQLTMEKYMDNKYVNFIYNMEANPEQTADIRNNLLSNIKYEIVEVGYGEGVAVAEVKVTNKDFSKVDNKYEESAYEYIMDNLYTKGIENKSKLNGKCLELYVKEINKAASGKNETEEVIYLPMYDNGHYGWNVELSNKNAKKILGNYDIPVK